MAVAFNWYGFRIVPYNGIINHCPVWENCLGVWYNPVDGKSSATGKRKPITEYETACFIHQVGMVH